MDKYIRNSNMKYTSFLLSFLMLICFSISIPKTEFKNLKKRELFNNMSNFNQGNMNNNNTYSVNKINMQESILII